MSENGYGFYRTGLEMRMEFKAEVRKRVLENYVFWFEQGSMFGEPGGTPPQKNMRGTPGCFCRIFRSKCDTNFSNFNRKK